MRTTMVKEDCRMIAVSQVNRKTNSNCSSRDSSDCRNFTPATRFVEPKGGRWGGAERERGR